MEGVGRVAVNGADQGGAVAVGDRTLLTAGHVVEGAVADSVRYLPIGGGELQVVDIRSHPSLDVAALTLADDPVPLELTQPRRGLAWRAMSPPLGEPTIGGDIDALQVPVFNRASGLVEMVQLNVGQGLGDYHGYSGSGVLVGDDNSPAVAAVLVEQVSRRSGALGGPQEISNVLYAVSAGLAIDGLGLAIPVEEFVALDSQEQARDEAAAVTAWCQWADDEVRRVDRWLLPEEQFYAVLVRNDGGAPATEVIVTCFATTSDGEDLELDWYAPALPGERTHYVLKQEMVSFPPDGDPPDVDIEYTLGARRWWRHNNGPVEPLD